MGATIRTLRGHAHLSQSALGSRVSMHANYLGAIERGEIVNPGLETVDRIAAGLDVSVAVLARSYAAAPEEVALRVDATGGRPQQLATPYDAKALGAAIRIARRAAGLTQAQLADIAGLHRNHVGSIELGEQPTRGIATIARIAHGLTIRLGADESLLPLFVQAFTGEATLAQVRGLVASEPSGPLDARVPQASADRSPEPASAGRAVAATCAPRVVGARLPRSPESLVRSPGGLVATRTALRAAIARR